MKFKGQDIIVLEEHPKCFVWIAEAKLLEMKAEIQADWDHPEPLKAGMGYRKYDAELKELGIDLRAAV